MRGALKYRKGLVNMGTGITVREDGISESCCIIAVCFGGGIRLPGLIFKEGRGMTVFAT